VTEKRISDKELDALIEKSCVQRGGFMLTVGGDAATDALLYDLRAARTALAALAKFKAYVHRRLDEAGVPTDPDSPHKAEGCRIGGRLDIVLALREQGGAFDHLEAAREACRLSPGESAEAEALRAEFRKGAQWQSRQPQQPALPSPAPAPPLSYSFSATGFPEMLRDCFALAFVAAGRDEKEAYKLADVVMKVRDAMECRDKNQPARVP
jgi:hypothetical protein